MAVRTPAVLGVLYACVLCFCTCTFSTQLSMLHMERHSRNITIIIISCFGVSGRTGLPGVSLLSLVEKANLIYSTYLNVAACKIVNADLSMTIS